MSPGFLVLAEPDITHGRRVANNLRVTDMRNKILVLAMAAAGVAFSGASVAANNPAAPSVGAPATTVSSTGDLTVSVHIPHRIMISGLQDIDLDDTGTAPDTYYGTAAGATGSSPACVYRNGSTATYSLTASSANPGTGGVFQMASTATTPEFIAYSVSWGGTTLTEGGTETGLTPDSRTSTTCGGTPTAGKVSVSATDTDLSAVNPGLYSDTLTLLVTAE